MSDDRYFQLLDHVGRDPEGNLEPLVEVGVTVPRLTMRDGEPVALDDRVQLKPVQEGARIFKTDDPVIADGLLATGLVEEIDPPTKSALAKAKKETQDAAEAAGTHTENEEA